jgi:flagellar P-ring protein precursor FlgI
MKQTLAIALLVLSTGNVLPAATRLKELVTLEGVRDNQLIGYGLVVGLAGTGDRRQAVFSAQSLTNMLERMGLSVPAAAIQVKNTAAVMVTANLPPYAQPGSRIDVTVAALADASSIQGGILLMTSLRGPDSQVYVVAQGAAVLGGFAASRAGNSQSVNHPTVGRIPNGGIVERPAPSVKIEGVVRLQLRQSDFTTASRIANALNERYGRVAKAENSALVSVSVPADFQSNPTGFIAEVERITVEPDRTERVIINERTGTVVIGKDVHVSPVAIIHGNLTVEVQTVMQVSQPAPLSGGSTQTVPQVAVGVTEQAAKNVILKEGATVEELVRALNAIGATPRDIIAILQNLKSAGALQAEVEVI